MDRKSLPLALIEIALVFLPFQFAHGQAEQKPATFFSGAELADRLLHNVVLIRTKEDLKGAGFVVGTDGEWLYVATALHTLRTPEEDEKTAVFSASIGIRFCASEKFGVQQLSASEIYLVDEERDLAAFKIRSPNGFKLVEEALSANKPAAGAKTWSIGKEGECKIGSADGAIDTAEDKYGNLTIDISGAYGGTSGSPVITDRGIVGLVWSSADSVKVLARSIDSVRALLTSSPVSKWTLTRTGNLPAATREAANWELTKTLNDYVFTAKDMRDAFVKDTYHFILLGPVVDRYNVSIKAFNEVKDRHDGTLEREWGTGAREGYAAIRSKVESIHARLLEFNKNMDALRRGNRIPKAIRAQMTAISPDIDALDTSAQQFLRNLKQDQFNE